MRTILVLSMACSVRMVSRKPRIFSEKTGQGTYSAPPKPTQASFAPRKMVKRRVCVAPGAVVLRIMRAKSSCKSELV